MKLILAATTILGLVGGGTLAVQQMHRADIVQASFADTAATPPRRIIIGLDISKSNPLVDNAAFADKVAVRISNIVKGLGMASEVHVRTFGSYDASSNN